MQVVQNEFSQMTVNEVIQRYPVTLTIFHLHGMDTCCRGNLLVGEAAKDANVDAATLYAELELITADA
jgi:iron-sulfur cluster repair protein YtfE (RIC family)